MIQADSEQEHQEFQKHIRNKRRRKIILLTMVILFIFGIVFSTTGYLIYNFYYKPTQERMAIGLQVTSFLEYYTQEIDQQEMKDVRDLLTEDKELHDKGLGLENTDRDEYLSVVRQRQVLYQQGIKKLEAAKEKLKNYDTPKEIRNVKAIMLEAFHKRIEAYQLFDKGFDDIFAGKESTKFEEAQEKLKQATELEEKASEELDKEIEKLSGVKTNEMS
ncbi:hypothetical protein KKC60_05595 [Patescibacteria group bacterium]|nr:hypothetical protein [Patescibacteria group bacterium]